MARFSLEGLYEVKETEETAEERRLRELQEKELEEAVRSANESAMEFGQSIDGDWLKHNEVTESIFSDTDNNTSEDSYTSTNTQNTPPPITTPPTFEEFLKTHKFEDMPPVPQPVPQKETPQVQAPPSFDIPLSFNTQTKKEEKAIDYKNEVSKMVTNIKNNFDKLDYNSQNNFNVLLNRLNIIEVFKDKDNIYKTIYEAMMLIANKLVNEETIEETQGTGIGPM